MSDPTQETPTEEVQEEPQTLDDLLLALLDDLSEEVHQLAEAGHSAPKMAYAQVLALYKIGMELERMNAR